MINTKNFKNKLLTISTLATIVLFVQCSSPTQTNPNNTPISMDTIAVNDPHSFAKPQIARTKHLNLDIELDFKTQSVNGTATWHIEKAADATEIVFDLNGPEIKNITYADGQKAAYQIGDTKPHIGRPLRVSLRPTDTTIIIEFRASQAAALQWLSPEQTASKSHPYMYTQGQAILSRSWFPCQDSPGIRFTYRAKVSVPQGLLPVMSAQNPTKIDTNGQYVFEMNNPIPAYLLVVAAGNLQYQALSTNTGIYAEPDIMEAAMHEFAETPDMLAAAEKLYGKYLWKQYDLLIMPPAFPFGGMENPMLTFVTPTVLAGDRSLTSLIAHELAHSWSGNLVTNATWNDFWLNEGFTVYFERRIMEALEGPAYAQMLEVLGWQDLQSDLDDLGRNNPETALKGKLEGKNPEDIMTHIPYEKGFFLIKEIEQKIGRNHLDGFLNYYFDKFAFKAMTTELFLEVFYDFCEQKNITAPEKTRLESWIYQPGLPADVPTPQSPKLDSINQWAKLTLAGTMLPTQEATMAWSSHEWLYYLRKIKATDNNNIIAQLDSAFSLTQSNNSEVLFAWLQLGIKNHYQPALQRSFEFLKQVGRNKFLAPTYRALVQHGYQQQAKQTYQEAQSGYHYISKSAIGDILN